MTLTNYWWLLIWLAVYGGFLTIVVPKQPVQILGKTEYRWGMIPALILAAPYAVWAMNRSDFGDTESYRMIYQNFPATFAELPAYLAANGKDRGFSVLSVMIKSVIGDNDKLFF